MTLKLKVQAAITCLLLPISAQAWNSLGHQVVAEIAWRQLPPNERQAIVEILRRHPRFDTDFANKLMDETTAADKATQDHLIFLQAAVWPDLIRGNKEFDRPTWHYIDFPLYLTPADEAAFAGKLPVNLSLDYPTDLPREKYNVIQAIAHCKTALQSRAGPDVKAVAYCWLFHLVGDIHQPLHSTALFSHALFPEGDRGGNDVLLLRGKNLHSLWDNLLGKDSRHQNVQKNAFELFDKQHYGEVWSSAPKVVDPNQWAAESHAYCQSLVYPESILVSLRNAPTGAKPAPSELPEAYYRSAGDLARRRILAAGLRLAEALKTIQP